MKGSEIIEQWGKDSIKDHKKNILICMCVLVAWFLLLMAMLLYGTTWTEAGLAIVVSFCSMRGFVFVVEWEARREREHHKSWTELERRLTVKSKIV